MKALEKDRSRRYETANGLAADVDRYLADEPVQACPPSAGYRFRKFARRNRLGLIVAAVVAAALLIAVGSLAVAAVRIDGALDDKTAAYDELKDEKQKTDDALTREKLALALILDEQVRTRRALSHHAIALADREWWLNHPDRTEELLDSVPAEFRRWEWHYLKRRCHRELLALRGHTARVYLASWSADGKEIITAGSDGTIRAWDAGNGGELRRIDFTKQLVVLDISADGRRAVLGGGKQPEVPGFWVIDTVTGRELFSTTDLPKPSKAHSAAFSPDGKRVALGAFRFLIKIIDLSTGREERTLTTEDLPATAKFRTIRGVSDLAFSPDGKLFATVVNGEPTMVVTWEAATGRPIPQVPQLSVAGSGAIQGIDFSPDGNRLAGVMSGEVFIRNVRGGTTLHRLPRYSEDDASTEQSTGNLDFCPNSLSQNLAVGGNDGTVRVWAGTLGLHLHALRAHSARVNAVAFSPDGNRLVTASDDHSAKVWRVSSQDATVLSRTELNRFPFGSLAVAPDGGRFAGGPSYNPDLAQPVIRIWEEPGGKEVTIDCGTTKLNGLLRFSPDGRYLIAPLELPAQPKGVKRLVKLYDSRTGREQFATPESGVGEFYSLMTSRDGSSLVVLKGNSLGVRTLQSLDAETFQLRNTTELHRGTQVNLRWLSNDGRWLSTECRVGDANELHLWDLKTPCAESRLIARGEIATSDVAFSPDGRILVVGKADGVIALWDLETGTTRQSWTAHQRIGRVAVNPDGTRLATVGSDRRVKLWDMASGRELLALPAIRNLNLLPLGLLDFSPDGHRLLLSSSDRAVIWDATPWVDPSF
jgi:WD40 repeat protein